MASVTAATVELERLLPRELHGLGGVREGARLFVERLPQVYGPTAVGEELAQEAWARVGNFYRAQGRLHEAITIYFALYDQMLAGQEQTGHRIHKGMPLVWLSECYKNLGLPLISLRWLMLTLVEDAIEDQGRILPEKGVYFRAVWSAGLPHAEVERYGNEAYEWSVAHAEEALIRGTRIARGGSELGLCPRARRGWDISRKSSLHSTARKWARWRNRRNTRTPRELSLVNDARV
jgi:hypothetical protein